MENVLIRGAWKKGKTILLSEYTTTKDLDCHKYVVHSNLDIVEYLYSVKDVNIHILSDVCSILKDSRSHNEKIVIVADDISTNSGWKHFSDIIEELQVVLKDRLIIIASVSITTLQGKETEQSRLKTEELVNKFNFTKVLDIDIDWVLKPLEPAKLFKYNSKEVDVVIDINTLAGKWFHIRERNMEKFKAGGIEL